MAIDAEKLKRLQEIMESPSESDNLVYEVEAILAEEGSADNAVLSEMTNSSGSRLLLEHETYKKFGGSPVMTYRIDKGDGSPGRQTHVHVFMKDKQLFAINMDGTSHDGSKAKLSKNSIKFLKTLGVTPPEDGLLEWIELDTNNKQLLFD